MVVRGWEAESSIGGGREAGLSIGGGRGGLEHLEGWKLHL